MITLDGQRTTHARMMWLAVGLALAAALSDVLMGLDILSVGDLPRQSRVPPGHSSAVFIQKGEISMHVLTGGRIALLIAGLIGMAMCSRGIGRVAAANRWLDPLSLVGYALGIVALVVIGAGVSGRTLPLVSTERQALLALLAIIAVKVGLTALHSRFI